MKKILISKQAFLAIFFNALPEQIEINCGIEFDIEAFSKDRRTTMQLHISRPFQSSEYGLLIGHFGFSIPAKPVVVVGKEQ